MVSQVNFPYMEHLGKVWYPPTIKQKTRVFGRYKLWCTLICTPCFTHKKHSFTVHQLEKHFAIISEAEKPSGRTTVSRIWLKLSPKDKYFRPHCLAVKRVGIMAENKVATYTESADTKKLWKIWVIDTWNTWKLICLTGTWKLRDQNESINIANHQSTRPYKTSNLQNRIQPVIWRDAQVHLENMKFLDPTSTSISKE